jgi:hypothetical protein
MREGVEYQDHRQRLLQVLFERPPDPPGGWFLLLDGRQVGAAHAEHAGLHSRADERDGKGNAYYDKKYGQDASDSGFGCWLSCVYGADLWRQIRAVLL